MIIGLKNEFLVFFLSGRLRLVSLYITADDSDLDFKSQVRKIKELYGWHFPELGILVKDDITFIKVIKLMGKCNGVDSKSIAVGIMVWVNEKPIVVYLFSNIKL